MHHNMEEEGGIFSFEQDEDFLLTQTKSTLPYIQVSKPNSNCNSVCDSRVANFDHEEIVTLRPRNSFSFDILTPDSGSQEWSRARANPSKTSSDSCNNENG